MEGEVVSKNFSSQAQPLAKCHAPSHGRREVCLPQFAPGKQDCELWSLFRGCPATEIHFEYEPHWV